MSATLTFCRRLGAMSDALLTSKHLQALQATACGKFFRTYHSTAFTIFKVVGWAMATISGLLVWNMLPETRAIISCGMVVVFICYGISIVVGVTVKRPIRDELRELRLQSNATACRLELIDRRVTAILRDALEQRQAASMRGAIRTTPRQAYDQQRRSA